MFRFDASPDDARSASARANGIGLTGLVLALWRNRFLIVGLALLFAALAAAYSMTLQNKYQATAQILVDPRDLRVIGTDVSPNNLNSDSIAAYIESQTRIFTSTDTLRRIVDREALTRDDEYSGAGSILSRLIPGRKSGDETLSVMEQLRRNLWVRRGEKTFIIDVSVTGNTPEKSARLTNAFASAYLEDQTSARAEQSRRASASLTSRLSELRDRVRASEEKVEAYKAQKNIVGASGKLITEEQLAQLSNQLAFARSRLADARAKLDQADSVRGQAAERGAIPEAVNSQTLGILRQQLGEAQRRAATLATSLGPQHPDLLAAQNTLRDAQRAVGEEIGRIRQAARADYDRAVSNEKALTQQVEQLKKDTLGTSRDTVELRELERELESNRAVYQAFLTRARETRELQGVDTSNIRIITTAVPPLERVGPQRRLMVVGAGIGGAALGILFTLLAELMTWFRNRTANGSARSAPAEAAAEAAAPASAAGQWQAEAFGQAAAAGAAAQPPSQAQSDLMRVLRMMGQLEKAIDRYGMPR
ncbi:MAG: GumC family protein [Beijerinckiaceae bacterium]